MGDGGRDPRNTKKEGSTKVMCVSHSSIGSKLRVKIPMFDELIPQGYCCALTNDEVESVTIVALGSTPRLFALGARQVEGL